MTVLEATRETFRDLVADGDVLVDMWGTSCTTCLALDPDVERLAAEHDELTVVKLEASKARRLCMELKVLGLPAFLLFHDGEEVSRLGGPDLSGDRLRSWLADSLRTNDDTKEVD